jgi:hypothetical protein
MAGTLMRCFADFKTSQSIIGTNGMNNKGVFTRDRCPKQAAHMLHERWGKRRREYNREGLGLLAYGCGPGYGEKSKNLRSPKTENAAFIQPKRAYPMAWVLKSSTERRQ